MNVAYILLLINVVSFTKCAKILGVFPSPGYSQFILAESLMLELVRRGHEVTVISAYKPKENIKNYRPILVDGLIKTTEENLFEQENVNLFNAISILEMFGQVITGYILAHEEVQQLIHSNETFDVVIVEQFLNEAHMGFATHFNAPLITWSSLGLSEWNSHLVGNVRPLSVNPFTQSQYTDKMTFFQRVHNTLVNSFYAIYKELVSYPAQQELLTKYFPGDIKLKDIMYNTSILLMNSHASTNHPTTLTTSVIEIGGFHISTKKLPSDIKKYLDDATDGAIFFSMGSNLKSADLPKDKLNGILKVFSKLKQRVLWKFEETDIPNKPENVFISKWLPQSDILAHPNIVAFITHGGLLSSTEAVHHGVPMIGIPIFGDQKMNVAKSVQKQIAVHLPFKELSEESLSAALQEVLKNPKYSRNAKEFSNVLKDQMAKPLDVAMFWIEYVIRHGGAPHLRNAAIELYWFQLYLLDVICFIVLCVVAFYYVAKLLLRRIFGKNTKALTSKTHKQKVN
ncbi:UDP-glucuronosyltransferase 2B7-like [Anoplophora glabripennis]|uniref:UDP-glucuronosyltransferase 2B7-like n=1 Tax=Anoplophora glabripennis TaxID=217634 RepID=UPI0008738370|nr:UDP-glucuronosyltransferase 2B7-like [Anoplophora glabripennis]